MKGGYAGKLLFVDLTRNTIEEEKLPDTIAEKFIGGYGIGARILYKMMKPGSDPLGPDNVLGFITGPLTATGAYFSGRYTVVCKSPVTGGWNDANSGGFFGPELKKSGFDAVFISGISEKPVYIWINDSRVEIRDAGSIWGKDSIETLEALKHETGEEKLRAVVIGPAGEKRSLMACVMNEGHRAAGRGGTGAVMGSKNLKALAVYGTKEIEVCDPVKLKNLNSSIRDSMKNGPMAMLSSAFGQYGTGTATVISAQSGDSPVKNWKGSGIKDFPVESAAKLGSFNMDAKYRKKKYACSSCPLGCGAQYEVKDGEWPTGETYRPEYETMSSYGSLCLNDNPESIIKCNDICNRYGIDTISAGATIAWAIECYEEGIITREETDGIELKWGNSAAIVKVTQAIADHKGFGAVLALGSRAAAEKLGKGFQFLQTINGIELPMHDAKFAPGYARTYLSDPTPGRHVKGGLGVPQSLGSGGDKYNTEDTGLSDVAATASSELVSAAGLCMFCDYTGIKNLVADFIEAVTGLSIDNKEQINIGLRIINMRHAFNLREGLSPSGLRMPERAVGEIPLKEGPLKDIKIDYRILQKNFCNAIKWDENTWKPSRESLEMLGGMEDVINDLYGQ